MTLSLVTGAGGFVGRNLVSALRLRGRSVIAMVHDSASKRLFSDQQIETVVADIRHPDQYASVAGRADEIYHLASIVAPHDIEAAREVNVRGTQQLAQCIASSQSPGCLIYVSSLSASGACLGGLARKESDPADPVSIYGKTKLEAELALAEMAGKLPISVARPPGIFGPWDQNLLAMYKSIAWRINTIGISRSYRYSFIHVEDLLDGLICMAERGNRLRGSGSSDQQGVYFLSDSDPLTFEQLGNQIADSLGKRHPMHVTIPTPICLGVAFCSDWYGRLLNRRIYLNIDKMREARAGEWVCDTSRAQNELGFSTKQSLAVRLTETYQWYRDNGWLK